MTANLINNKSLHVLWKPWIRLLNRQLLHTIINMHLSSMYNLNGTVLVLAEGTMIGVLAIHKFDDSLSIYPEYPEVLHQSKPRGMSSIQNRNSQGKVFSYSASWHTLCSQHNISQNFKQTRLAQTLIKTFQTERESFEDELLSLWQFTPIWPRRQKYLCDRLWKVK